ncbi:MAG: DNA gyrase modulator, partial [Oscillospiraceae bacterium]
QNAQEQGVFVYDLYYKKQQDTSFSAYKGEIEKFSGNTSLGVCFRCIIDGKMGYYSTELLNEQEAKNMVLSAKASAQAIDSADEDCIYEGSVNQQPQKSYSELSASHELANKLLELEKITLEQDHRVSDLSCTITQTAVEVSIANSYGLDVQNSYSYIDSFVSPIVVQDNVKYNA